MQNAATTMNDTVSLPQTRQIAWQVALLLPFGIIAAVASIGQPAAYWQSVSGLLLLVTVSVAAIIDARSSKIPNWITYSAFAWGLALNGVSHFLPETTAKLLGTVGIADSLAGGLVPFFFMLVIFSMTGGGAGDVKLTAAMGALLGLGRVTDAILLSFILAGGIALLRAIWVQGPKNLIETAFRTIGHWIVPLWVLPPNSQQREFMREPMPLGPSFALGTFLVLFDIRLASLFEVFATLWGGR